MYLDLVRIRLSKRGVGDVSALLDHKVLRFFHHRGTIWVDFESYCFPITCRVDTYWLDYELLFPYDRELSYVGILWRDHDDACSSLISGVACSWYSDLHAGTLTAATTLPVVSAAVTIAISSLHYCYYSP